MEFKPEGRWSCQRCNKYLEIGRPGNAISSSKMDNSFVVLQKDAMEGRNARSSRLEKEPIARKTKSQVSSILRPVDESFVVLPGGPLGNDSTLLEDENSALSRVFDIASQSTCVDYPLCNSCIKSAENDLNAKIREVEEDIFAYESCLKKWENEVIEGPSISQLESKLRDAQLEEQQLLAELKAIETENSENEKSLEELKRQMRQYEDMEKKYFEELNKFSFDLSLHQENRDAILNQIEVGSFQLEALKNRNVINDAFHIWFDGDFGTINGLRLGRLPRKPVDWDELNAAWGQVCLLLAIMAQISGVQFKYQILTMGSYPRIADGKNIYNLYGPVNLFWSARYDQAMVYILACLKEYAEFATAKDKSSGLSLDQSFKLPYKIHEDKVGSFSVKQALNSDERWTKALKFMLCNLKWEAAWFVKSIPMRG